MKRGILRRLYRRKTLSSPSPTAEGERERGGTGVG